MGKIIYVPLEPFEERYTSDWYNYFKAYANSTGEEFGWVDGKQLTEGIEVGRFLDVYGTNYYKASQLQALCSMVRDKQIVAGDTVFFFDLWFPGVEMLAYIRDAAQVEFKIAGMLHAGTYDDWDYITQMGMRRWGKHFEKMLLEIADTVFVATFYHRNLLAEEYPGYINKVVVNFFPIKLKQIAQQYSNVKKERRIVCFPHRLDPEKQPHRFFEAEKSIGKTFAPEEVRWVVTKREAKTKDDYYKLLAQSTISVSCAMQETWGIAMLESAALGAIPLVPNRLSYPELYPIRFRYRDQQELCALIGLLLRDDKVLAEYRASLGVFVDAIDPLGEGSIKKMMRTLQEEE